jgi:hypothetical protein
MSGRSDADVPAGKDRPLLPLDMRATPAPAGKSQSRTAESELDLGMLIGTAGRRGWFSDEKALAGMAARRRVRHSPLES